MFGPIEGQGAAVLGLLLVVLGAWGATRSQPGGAGALRSLAPLVPFGVLIGAGAAMVRGGGLVAGIVGGAVLVPLVGALGRVRRRRDPAP
ncbi:MAG: hypothetical protein RLZZ272_825 [Actinomycetota bacterium]